MNTAVRGIMFLLLLAATYWILWQARADLVAEPSSPLLRDVITYIFVLYAVYAPVMLWRLLGQHPAIQARRTDHHPGGEP